MGIHPGKKVHTCGVSSFSVQCMAVYFGVVSFCHFFLVEVFHPEGPFQRKSCLNTYYFLIMFDGFEVSGGQINPDLLDFSHHLNFPVESFLDPCQKRTRGYIDLNQHCERLSHAVGLTPTERSFNLRLAECHV